MKIYHQGETLRISDVKELALANASGFCEETRSALNGEKRIVIDLSETGFLDCGGIGALIALRNNALQHRRDISVKVVNPTPSVRRILELTHLDSMLESSEASVAA
jgi:anti-anti-sigma factor